MADEPKPLPVAKPEELQCVTDFLKTQPRNFIFNGHQGSVMWLSFTPDGKTLASSSRDASIDIWDITKASSEIATLQKKIRHHTKDVYCICYSPDGKLLASAGADGLLCLWDVASDYALKREQNVGLLLRNCAFSPDGKTLASCGDKGSVQLWDVEKLELKRSLKGQTAMMKAVEFSSDGEPENGTALNYFIQSCPVFRFLFRAVPFFASELSRFSLPSSPLDRRTGLVTIRRWWLIVSSQVFANASSPA
jgi:WD40 repeat protein